MSAFDNVFEFERYNFEFLRDIIPARKKQGRGKKKLINQAIIAFDTETSKKFDYSEENKNNHICSWSITLQFREKEIVTLIGRRPRQAVRCFEILIENLCGEQIICFVHNLSYDWQFMRGFLIENFGEPVAQLNTRPHYPLTIDFENGLQFRDSLSLARRTLARWSFDLRVKHKKALGFWDYDKKRNQNTKITRREWVYQINDTRALAECVETMCIQLKKWVGNLPLTITGVGRDELRKIAISEKYYSRFLKQSMPFDLYKNALQAFHGGYTHGNRFLVNETIFEKPIKFYDEGSAYPYAMLSEKYPIENFTKINDCTIDLILRNAEKTAFLFLFCADKIELKDPFFPAPVLQFSKCVKTYNAIRDNGRILQAEFLAIYITEIDLKLICKQYIFENAECYEVYSAAKGYLPKWFTNYIFECWKKKQEMKNGDPVLYALQKEKVNINYGITVQKPTREEIREDYDTGLNYYAETDEIELYTTYLKNRRNFLPYQWGIWVTAYALQNLFEIIDCAGEFLYSDTDSVCGIDFDEMKLNAYNNRCKNKIAAAGFSPVFVDGVLYDLGVAELDKDCTQFKFLGAKRYCYRDKKDGALKITVAGVPKNGAKCLENKIENFEKGFVFEGKKTGKKGLTYIFAKPYIDKYGNETADSIDFFECDYKLNTIYLETWESFFENKTTTEIQVIDIDEIY